MVKPKDDPTKREITDYILKITQHGKRIPSIKEFDDWFLSLIDVTQNNRPNEYAY